MLIFFNISTLFQYKFFFVCPAEIGVRLIHLCILYAIKYGNINQDQRTLMSRDTSKSLPYKISEDFGEIYTSKSLPYKISEDFGEIYTSKSLPYKISKDFGEIYTSKSLPYSPRSNISISVMGIILGNAQGDPSSNSEQG